MMIISWQDVLDWIASGLPGAPEWMLSLAAIRASLDKMWSGEKRNLTCMFCEYVFVPQVSDPPEAFVVSAPGGSDNPAGVIVNAICPPCHARGELNARIFVFYRDRVFGNDMRVVAAPGHA